MLRADLEKPASAPPAALRRDSAIRYRPEIDGLRAIAVAAVALFHCGFGGFRGGFVGVDVFFVISGYLITSIVLRDLEAGRFSLARFYERRIRRILPALFLVMAVSCVFARLWMLPKDLESFGKSLIVTSVFASNLWELHSGGYWALPGQFKPLLHTWSLAIEEQFYVVYPLLLVGLRRLLPRSLVWALLLLAVASLVAAQALVAGDRQASFYLLPTRAWELLLGALVAVRPGREVGGASAQALSAAGLAMIAGAVATFGRATPTPGLFALVPTFGAALILAFATGRTLVGRLLATPVLVTIGLMSYSLYLWHFPVFAFARIYAVTAPSPPVLGLLLLGVMPVAYLSWRFVEVPARSTAHATRPLVFAAAAAISCLFVAYGFYLYRARGLPGRLYPASIGPVDDLYIQYNERAFAFRKDAFARRDPLRVLVVGNSFARDFINMTVETFDLRRVEIVYRDDFRGCIPAWTSPAAASLRAAADVIVLASRTVDYGCVSDNLAYAAAHSKRLFYVGSKYFGDNLNWLMRLDPRARADQTNPLPAYVLRQEAKLAGLVPHDQYISLLAPIVKDGRVPITDAQGRLISPDRTHLTRYGAQYLGRKALLDSPYGALLKSF